MSYIIKDRLLYPTDNHTDFEYYALKNITGTKRTHLPVTWTAFYKLASYGKDKDKIAELQRYLDGLKGKFFTICQWDDGILNDISHLDIKVFSMGNNTGYPLPLICTPHPFRFTGNRNIFCSFIGNNTHPIREKLLNLNNGWYITEKKHKIPDYCKILSRSVFGLCPRGYGVTSFRIMECLQYGCIPVYISDDFMFPHYFDFDVYGVTIHESELCDLEKILKSFTPEEIKRKQNMCNFVYRSYYTYDANVKIIVDKLKEMD